VIRALRGQTRSAGLLPWSILAGAATLGALAVVGPLIAIGAAAAIVLAFIVFSDLAAGFAIFAFLTFLDILPTSGSLSVAKGAGLLLALAWLARLAGKERDQQHFFTRHPQLTWALIAFLGWAALTLVWARSTGAGATALSRYLPNMLLVPIAYTAVRKRSELTIVLGAIVLGAILAASFGILQPPNPSLAMEERATGTIGDPNELAAALLIGLALGCGLVLARGLSLALRLTGALAIPLCVLGIFLSLSRGGLLALGALLVAGTMLAGRWRPAVAVVLAVVCVGGVFYFTQLASLPARERVTSIRGGSGRTDLWTVGWRMVRAHPVTGVGVGNFQVVSADYALQPGLLERSDLIFSAQPKIAHNTYLQVMADTGIPGLVLFLSVIVACLRCAWRAAQVWAKRQDLTMEVLARSLLLGLIGMLTADFFISQMYSKLLWAALALGPVMLAIARAEDARGDAPMSLQPKLRATAS
jgi:O-antigen ligase